jgi:hypothetical protein
MTTSELHQVNKIKLRGFNPLQGFFLASGDKWVKIHYIPVDFLVDGVVIIRKKYITNIKRTQDDAFVEKVINLKPIPPLNDLRVDLDDETGLFANLMSQNQLIQIYLHEDRISYVGKILRTNANTFRIRLLSISGEWLKEASFSYDSVRTIHINSDYLDSLSLLLKSQDSY